MAKKTKKAKKAKKAKKPSRALTAAVAAGLIQVVANIDAGANPPPDLMLQFQIDNKPLTLVKGTGRAAISTGVHTASWGVVSPIVRPLAFKVAITAADGRVLLSRPNEKTGADGMGVGADLFPA